MFCSVAPVARDFNSSRRSAKPNTAPGVLQSYSECCVLPSLSCCAPSIFEMLLNCCRRSPSFGQSLGTWTTVSRAPQTHRPGNHVVLCTLPAKSDPLRSCVSRYAWFRGRDPYSLRVRIASRVLLEDQIALITKCFRSQTFESTGG